MSINTTDLTPDEVNGFNGYGIYYRGFIQHRVTTMFSTTYLFVPEVHKYTMTLIKSESNNTTKPFIYIIKKIVFSSNTYYLIYAKDTKLNTNYELRFISFQNNKADYVHFPSNILEKPKVYTPKNNDIYFVMKDDVASISTIPIYRGNFSFGALENKTMIKDAILLFMKIIHSMYGNNSIMKTFNGASLKKQKNENQKNEKQKNEKQKNQIPIPEKESTDSNPRILFSIINVDQDMGQKINSIFISPKKAGLALLATASAATGIGGVVAIVSYMMPLITVAASPAIISAFSGAVALGVSVGATALGSALSVTAGGAFSAFVINSMYAANKNVSEKDSKYIDGYVDELNKIASEQKDKLTLDSNITLSGGKRKTQRRKKMSKKSKSMKRSQRK